MNPIEQQIAIAQAQGIVERGGGPVGIYYQDDNGNGDNYYIVPPDWVFYGRGPLPYRDMDGTLYKPLPDYLNDLNAMHEVEKTIDPSLYDLYEFWLGDITKTSALAMRRSFIGERFTLAHATASQRAEAYLRTIGKWKE